MHITNQAFNQYSKNFTIAKDDVNATSTGSRWKVEYSSFLIGFRNLAGYRQYLKDNGINDIEIWDRIKDTVVKAMISVEEKIVSTMESLGPARNCCFQLFGTDVDLDSDYKPWLIESNVNPTTGSKTAFEKVDKMTLLTDMFNVIGIVPFNYSSYIAEIEKV
jgi:hypothetical protein